MTRSKKKVDLQLIMMFVGVIFLYILDYVKTAREKSKLEVRLEVVVLRSFLYIIYRAKRPVAIYIYISLK